MKLQRSIDGLRANISSFAANYNAQPPKQPKVKDKELSEALVYTYQVFQLFYDSLTWDERRVSPAAGAMGDAVSGLLEVAKKRQSKVEGKVWVQLNAMRAMLDRRGYWAHLGGARETYNTIKLFRGNSQTGFEGLKQHLNKVFTAAGMGCLKGKDFVVGGSFSAGALAPTDRFVQLGR